MMTMKAALNRWDCVCVPSGNSWLVVLYGGKAWHSTSFVTSQVKSSQLKLRTHLPSSSRTLSLHDFLFTFTQTPTHIYTSTILSFIHLHSVQIYIYNVFPKVCTNTR